ncbi:MAG TPA: sialidase family protein [Pyrinomonadaceae bacterium]|nr:sialidase family protein [Pyrinomonadaceae bacterium]
MAQTHRLDLTFLLLTLILFVTACGAPESPTARETPRQVGGALVVRETESPAPPDSREPEMFSTADGRVILSWVEKVGEKRYALRFAERGPEGWGAPLSVAEGDDWFVNWADFPSVVKLADGSLAAHWLVKSGTGTYSYDVHVARSNDGGKTWGRSVVPHTDGTQTEHGFVSLLPLEGGRLGAFWLDGRNLKDLKSHEEEHGPLSASMTLRFAALDAEGRLSDEAELDARVCECCQTSAALTSEGPLVVYRDRSGEEVRDIFYVRRQGSTWSEPKPVHADGWRVEGCPVNGPSVAAEGRRVAVAWYTEAPDGPRVQAAFSDDAGATFGPPVRVDDGDAQGRVDVLLLPDGSALVCWLAGTPEKGAVKVRRVARDGTLDPASVVAESDIARSSGFPRMARHGSEVHFAWTRFGKPPRAHTASADVSAFR